MTFSPKTNSPEATVPAVVGLFRLGPLHLALPSELIQEVVPGPLDISPLPQAAWHVLGAATVHGQPLPVFDLATLLQPARVPTPLKACSLAVVIEWQGGRFALHVDEALALVPTRHGCLAEAPCYGDGAAPLYRHVFSPGAGRPVAALLDIEALLKVPGLRGTVLGAENRRRRQSRAIESYFVVASGTSRFALPTKSVTRILPRPARLDSRLDHPLVSGFHRIQNIDTPVMHLGALLGTTTTGEPGGHLLVSEHEGNPVAWEIDHATGLLPQLPSDFGPLAAGFTGRPDCVRGAFLDKTGATVVVLHPEALHGLPEVVRPPRSQADDGRRERGTDEAQSLRPYMVFRAGDGSLAVDLGALHQVAVIGDQFEPSRSSTDGVLGCTVAGGQSVPVLDLSPLLDRPPTALHAKTPVLIARTAQGLIGFAVQTVDQIHRAAARPLAQALPDASGRRAPIVATLRTRVAGKDAVASVLDLPRLIGRLQTTAFSAALL